MRVGDAVRQDDGSAVPTGSGDAYAEAAGYYDLFAAALGLAARPDAGAFAGFARPDDDVLDVGAGTGRVALAVAELGARVWCLEPSATMRVALLTKLAARPDLWPRVTVLPGAAPRFELGRQFDYAVLAGMMQFVAAADRPLLFATLRRHLRPDGRLALDMVDTEPVLEWDEIEVNQVHVGEWRYSLLVTARSVGPTSSRVTYCYRAERAGSQVDHVVERDRHHHLRPDVLADLTTAGFDGDAARDGGDGGLLVCGAR